MHFELQMFALLLLIGLLVRRLDWRGQFFLLLLVGGWIVFNLRSPAS